MAALKTCEDLLAKLRDACKKGATSDAAKILSQIKVSNRGGDNSLPEILRGKLGGGYDEGGSRGGGGRDAGANLPGAL